MLATDVRHRRLRTHTRHRGGMAPGPGAQRARTTHGRRLCGKSGWRLERNFEFVVDGLAKACLQSATYQAGPPDPRWAGGHRLGEKKMKVRPLGVRVDVRACALALAAITLPVISFIGVEAASAVPAGASTPQPERAGGLRDRTRRRVSSSGSPRAQTDIVGGIGQGGESHATITGGGVSRRHCWNHRRVVLRPPDRHGRSGTHVRPGGTTSSPTAVTTSGQAVNAVTQTQTPTQTPGTSKNSAPNQASVPTAGQPGPPPLPTLSRRTNRRPSPFKDGQPDDRHGGRPDGDLHLCHREHGRRRFGQRRRDRCPAGTLPGFEPRSDHVHHGDQRVHHVWLLAPRPRARRPIR